jgi:two-component system, chemotaxis family, protein-glutamate methylesterase/glutaminase
MRKIRIIAVYNRTHEVKIVRRSMVVPHDLEIAGEAPDFKDGWRLINLFTPDIVLAEDGPGIVEFTSEVLAAHPEIGIIIVIPIDDPASPKRVITALAGGAFDFVIAEKAKSLIETGQMFSNLLLSKIRCCSIRQYSRIAKNNIGTRKTLSHGLNAAKEYFLKLIENTAAPTYDAVLIGVSTGGPIALIEMLPAFPENFPVPVFIVLHMPKEFTGPMAATLDRKTKIRVSEIVDGAEAIAGRAYLAPGGFQCTVTREAARRFRFHVTDGPAENGCKPSVDVLFRSVAAIPGNRVIAVILTGMGNDGTNGCEAVKRGGGIVLAQDEASSVVWGMPGNVVRAGLTDEIVPLTEIPSRLGAFLGMQV